MTEPSTPQALVVGLGEAMLRLSAPDRTPLLHSKELRWTVAGSELNVLVAARALGTRARWLSRLPQNELGAMIRRHALANDVEVVAFDEPGARAGLFFYELGAPPRPSKILYDRDDSATSHLSADEFDWPKVLSGASAAHVTGITCALGKGPREATLAFLRAAKEAGVMTSFDMNYRSQLWSVDEARQAYLDVLPYVDTLFVAPRDLALLTESERSTELLAREVTERFELTTLVIRQRRELSFNELGVSVRVFGDDDGVAEASGVVVDEIGAGDAAAGAFLAAQLGGESPGVCAERCARAYARMLTIPGDTWIGTVHDLSDGYVVSRKLVR